MNPTPIVKRPPLVGFATSLAAPRPCSPQLKRHFASHPRPPYRTIPAPRSISPPGRKEGTHAMSEWYYTSAGQQTGPVTSAQLKQAAQSGQLTPNDLVWKDGMPDWVPATKLKGIFDGAPPPQHRLAAALCRRRDLRCRPRRTCRLRQLRGLRPARRAPQQQQFGRNPAHKSATTIPPPASAGAWPKPQGLPLADRPADRLAPLAIHSFRQLSRPNNSEAIRRTRDLFNALCQL